MLGNCATDPSPRLQRLLFPIFVMVLLFHSTFARAQAIIKVNDNVNIKFGTLIQAWGDEQQDATTRGYAQNLFLRRIRIIVAGQVAPNVTFFYESDNPNLGKAPKALGAGFITQDAFVEWKIRNEFILDGGLILIPLCRNCLQSAASLLTLDYGAYSFLQSAGTTSSVGRDTGVQVKGYLADQRLEYRAGMFQGIRLTGARDPFRLAGRLQYNFWDKEVGPFYTGTYLGKKKVLSIGGGVDRQESYHAYAADIFLDRPLVNKNSITAQVDYIRYDGGKWIPTLLEQNDLLAQFGYFVSSAKVLPFVRYDQESFRAAVNKSKDQKRYQVGLTYYPNGHNFNIKGAYTRVDPKVGNSTDEFTVQMQLFYF
jgi:hypothetical protein